jgi:glucokinase
MRKVPGTGLGTGEGDAMGEPGGRVAVAVDLGGTSLKCALVDPAGRVLHAERHPTLPDRGPRAVLSTVGDLVDLLVEKAAGDGHRPVGVGLAVPGVVDEAEGVAVSSANLGFHRTPVAAPLARRLRLPVAVGHDVRLGGLAEARLGAGQGSRSTLFVAIGTGVASAHVVGGRVDPGAHGASGELGHLVIRPAGPACGCGARGCLEAVASAAAIGRSYQERTGIAATAADVVARKAAGDRAARLVWRTAVDALADGLVIALTLLDPEITVIGGGLALAGSALLDPLGDAVNARLTFQPRPRLVRAALGDLAAAQGAGLNMFARMVA